VSVALRDHILRKVANPYGPGSLGYRARARRFAWLLERFPDFTSMNVIDLGGDTRAWRSADVRPAHLTIVGIEDWALTDPEPWMSVLQADACDPNAIPGGFDLVYSNSTIEHVGGPRYRRGFAETVRSSGVHYWIQTPYRYFPLEPHLVFPGFQFLPPVAKKAIARKWPLSLASRHPTIEPLQYALDHDLLTITEMRVLFPGAEIIRERVAGVVKSVVAVR
jgi:hypothetical protein